MLKEYSNNFIYYIIVIVIIVLVGWMIYAVYGPPESPIKNQSQGICSVEKGCLKQNFSEILKDNLTEAEKKLSTDLFQVIGTGNKSENQLVYVYIKTSEHVDPTIITPYVWNITNTDPANNLFVAWININNLTSLASLDSVQSIRSVTPPINK